MVVMGEYSCVNPKEVLVFVLMERMGCAIAAF